MSDGEGGRSSELTTLLSSASLVIVGTLFASVSKLIERVIIGRTLAVDAYGEVSIGIAVLTVVSYVALLGFGQGVPRYMSRFDDEAHVRGAWLTGLVLAVTGGVALAAIIVAMTPVLTTRLFQDPSSAPLLTLFAVTIPLSVGFHVGIGGVRGMENTRYRTYVQDLLYPLTRIGLLVVLLGLGFGVLAAGYAYVVAAAAAFVCSHYFLNRLMPLWGPFETDVGEMIRFSAPLMVSSVLSMLLVQTDTLMVGYFRTSAEVALYSAAYPLAYGLLLVLSAFGFVYLPLASRLDAGGERDELTAIYGVTTKWIFVLTFPAFVAFVVFPGDVLTTFFGARYAAGAPALRILTLGFFVNAAFGRNRQTLAALGHTNPLMISNVAAFVVNVGLNVALIPRFGFVGAAVASAASYATLNAAVSGYLAVRFGITPFSKAAVRTFVGLPAVMLPAAVLLSQRVDLTAVTLLPFLVAWGVCSLVVVVLVGGVQPEDDVAVSFVEDRLGVEVPFVRRYLSEDA